MYRKHSGVPEQNIFSRIPKVPYKVILFNYCMYFSLCVILSLFFDDKSPFEVFFVSFCSCFESINIYFIIIPLLSLFLVATYVPLSNVLQVKGPKVSLSPWSVPRRSIQLSVIIKYIARKLSFRQSLGNDTLGIP